MPLQPRPGWPPAACQGLRDPWQHPDNVATRNSGWYSSELARVEMALESVEPLPPELLK